MSMAIIGVAGVAVSAGTAAYGIYSSEKGKKEAAGRNAAGELGMLNGQAQGLTEDQMQNQVQYLRNMLAANPSFARQQRANQQLSAEQALALYPHLAATERLATSKTRESDVKDLDKYGAGYLREFAQNSPGFAALLGELNRPEGLDSVLMDKLSLDALGAGRSAIGRKLEAQALSELDLGRGLSADQERAATQGARGAWASRGLGFSNGAIGAEVLNRDQYATEREAQRRGFAGGVLGLLTNEDQANRSFGLDVAGSADARTQSRRGFLLNASEATSKPLYAMLGTRAPAHLMTDVIGAMGLGMNVGLPSQVASQAPSLSQYVPSTYGYGADAFNTNLNMMESRSIRSQNQQNALTGSLIGAGGQLAGVGLSNYGLGGTAGAYRAPVQSSLSYRPTGL